MWSSKGAYKGTSDTLILAQIGTWIYYCTILYLMFKRVNVIVYDMVMLKSMDPYYKSRTDYHLFLLSVIKNIKIQFCSSSFIQLIKLWNITGKMMIIEKKQYISRYVFSWRKKWRLGKLEGITFDEHFSLFVQVYIHDSYCVGLLTCDRDTRWDRTDSLHCL